MILRNKHLRRNRGASILLIVMAGFLLVAMAYGMFQLAMLLGGSRQVRNTTDAAVLNIARRITDVRVGTNPAYADVADSNGQVGVSNINRVWGKAYLISANIDEMAKNGQLGNGNAQGNGELEASARAITKDLATQGVELPWDSEMVALIAYLQRLGKNPPVPSSGPAPSSPASAQR